MVAVVAGGAIVGAVAVLLVALVVVLVVVLGVFGTTNDWPQLHFTDLPDKSAFELETFLHVGQVTCIVAASAGVPS